MRSLKLACLAVLLVTPAIAQPATPTASTKVDLTAADLQVALIAISNAGSACDIGVKQFCQIIPLRDATAVKLQAALTALQTPATIPVKK